MEIGERLKKARTDNGLTQEKVAAEIGVSRQSVSNWENNRAYPDIVSVIKLSDLYSVSLDELLKEDKKMIRHLAESTDAVKNQGRLVKRVTVIAYWGLWGLFILYYWLIVQPSGGYGSIGGLGNKELLLYIIYPLCIAAVSGFIGANKSFGKLRWVYVPFSGVMLMLNDLFTGYLCDCISIYYDAGEPFNPFEVIGCYFADNISAQIPMTFIAGCIGCALGIFIGTFIRFYSIAKADRADGKAF